MRLATFNLLNGMSVVDGQVDADRLHDAVTMLRADVLGLQEVDRAQDRSHRRDLTGAVATAMRIPTEAVDRRRFVPSLVGQPGGRWRPVSDDDVTDGTATDEPTYGIALVSRWPVQSWHVVRLGLSRLQAPVLVARTRRLVWLRDEPRTAVAAVVRTPVGPMTVATTHLSFIPGWNAVQLRRLTAALRELPAPRVLLGDLNLPGRLPRLVSGWTPLARVPTYPSWNPRVQFDHVLGHGDLPPVMRVETPEVAVSDHRPLVVEL